MIKKLEVTNKYVQKQSYTQYFMGKLYLHHVECQYILGYFSMFEEM